MTTHAPSHREKLSLQQLAAISQSRQIRLKAERQLLGERERELEQAAQAHRMDEELLAQQRAQWTLEWQAWAEAGGALSDALALGRDKVLLVEMAALLDHRRAELQVRADRLTADIRAWSQRWHAAKEFEETLAERGRVLRMSLERASERQRDEESLMALASSVGSSATKTVAIGKTVTC
jgi:hypothetical protein